MITCNDIINAADSVSTNVMSTVSTNVTSSTSKNGLLYSTDGFVNGHNTIYNGYYLLSWGKT